MKSLAESLGIAPPESPTQEPPKKLTAKQLSKAILESSEYRRSVERRIAADALPAAVECRLYDYAYGKPVDRVEIKDTTERLEDLTDAELLERIEKLRVQVAEPSVH